jgi:uncharacterized protein YodC (DUF2158 family)
MATFKLGDVVRLKSGGPDMTIDGMSEQSSGGFLCHCKWFEYAEQKDAHFMEASLEPVEKTVSF